MLKKIQLRRDLTTNWEINNPILAEAELGIDSTLNKIKIGDGETEWNNLFYLDAGLATEEYVDTAIDNLPAVSLAGLATEEYVDTAIDNLPAVSLAGLATEEYVDTAIIDSNTISYTVKVVEDGSGDQETFEINGNKVKDSQENTFNIVFQLGKIYRFDLSHVSNALAPLRFSTTPDTIVTVGNVPPGTVTPYTNNVNPVGTAGTPGSYIEITITEETPSVIYFYAEEELDTIDTSNIGGSVQHIFPKTCCYRGNKLITEALDLTKSVNFFNCGEDSEITLADGVEGQTLTLISLGGATESSMTIIVNQSGWSSGEITFDNIEGKSCTLQFLNTKWYCIANNEAVF